MSAVRLESVSKIFRHRPALFNWLGRERTGETHALDQVSLEVPSGSVLVLLGPNGSGKTTTLKLISTMLLPDAGRVLVLDMDTQRESRAVRERVGFAVATERSFFPRLSARENLDFFAALDDIPRKRRAERVDELLARTGLRDAADTLVMKFSSGMYQRLGIARALIKRPSVVLLDEPTRSLDPGSAAQFWNLVRELPAQSTTVILATHNFNEAVAVGNHVADPVQRVAQGRAEAFGEYAGRRIAIVLFSDHGGTGRSGTRGRARAAMSLGSLLDKTIVIARRDLLTAVRYRTGFLLGATGAITELAAFYYLSRAVGPGFRPDGLEYFSFLLVSTGFYTFLLMGVHAFLQTVQEAQQTGTLEVLMTTSTSPPVLVFLSAMSAFAANTVTLLFYLAAGLLFGAPLHLNLAASVAGVSALGNHRGGDRPVRRRLATGGAEGVGRHLGTGVALVPDRNHVPGSDLAQGAAGCGRAHSHHPLPGGDAPRAAGRGSTTLRGS